MVLEAAGAAGLIGFSGDYLAVQTIHSVAQESR